MIKLRKIASLISVPSGCSAPMIANYSTRARMRLKIAENYAFGTVPGKSSR